MNTSDSAPSSAAARVEKPFEIRRNDDGGIDEIVAHNCNLHIEQLTRDGWFIGIETSDGVYLQIWIGAEKPARPKVVVRHTDTMARAKECAEGMA